MKATLAIVIAVLVWVEASNARLVQSQQPAQAGTPQQAGAEASPQQGTPPPSPPCPQSKDVCDLAEPAPQAPASASPSQTQPQGAAQPKSQKSRRKKMHRKPAQKPAVAGGQSGPMKTVIRNGSTSDPTAVLTPGVTTHSKYSPQMTANLLSATDANLKEASARSLDANQTATIDQIKVFMEKANAAVKAGDLDRGYNLALKAHLLSDDLVKH